MNKHLQKRKKEKEKWQIENLGNLGKVIPSFLVSYLPYNQLRKLGFKNLGKKIPRFPSFRPGRQRKNFSFREVLKTKNFYVEDVLKTCHEKRLEGISWRRLKDVLETNKMCTGDITNLTLYVTNLYITNLYLTNLWRIQNALIKTQ